MKARTRRFTGAAIALSALGGFLAIPATADAIVPYVAGTTVTASEVCLDIGTFPPSLSSYDVADITVSVTRSDALKLPKATLTAGTTSTFMVKVHVAGVFHVQCQPGNIIPTLTLPAGVHIDPSAAFPIVCTKNGTPLASDTAACPGKKNLVKPSPTGPLNYRSSANDFYWAFTFSDTYDFEFPVYADRVFSSRSIIASVAMPGADAGKSTVSAAVFRPPLTCNNQPVTVAALFGESSTNGNDVIAGGSGVDHISGGFGNDVICAGPGNDIVDGGPGNDIIIGGPGNDLLSGGTGTDTASYVTSTAVKVNLSTLGPQATGGAGSDTLGDFENVTGSNFADVLTGTSRANRIVGGGGTDTCDGLGGVDTAVSCEHSTAIP